LYKLCFTRKKTIVFCLMAWLLGICIDLPNFFGWGGYFFDTKSGLCYFLILVLISLLLESELLFVYQAHCMWNRLANHSYTIFFASVSIFIPCFLILIAYLRIFFYAHKSRRNIKSNSDEISHSVKIATSLFASFALFTMCW